MTRAVRVTRADVYAARTRVILDRKSGVVTPEWIVKLSQVKIR